MSDRHVRCDVRDILSHRHRLAPDPYKIVFLDPPWKHNDRRLIRKDGKRASYGIGSFRRYGELSLENLKEIPLPELTAPRCHVYLWATAPLLPQAFELMGSWKTERGRPVFKYATTAYVWVKLNSGLLSRAIKQWQLFEQSSPPLPTSFLSLLERLVFFGTGFYTASNAEFVLLFRRGKPFRHVKGCKARQVILAPRGRHSEKPESAQDRTTYMYPDVAPRLELFARRIKKGWDVTGNDPALDG